MKLSEISIEKFNNLAYAEPDATIYQTSHWSDYQIHNGYKPLFLEYAYDNGSAAALAMFLLKKNSLFRYTAFCPRGFLINYYDNLIVRSFVKEIVEFMKNLKVNRIVIEPYIPASASENYVHTTLKELGFVKTKDLYSYRIETETFESYKINEHIILKAKKAEKEDLSFLSLFPKKNAQNYHLIYEALKDYASIYTVSLDSFKSKRNSQEYIEECERFIINHKNDYKFEEENRQKQEEIARTENALEYMEKLEKKNGKDPLIGCMCVVEYGESFSIVFSASIDQRDILNAEEILINKIIEDAKENGSIIIEGSQFFTGSSQVEMMGEFTLDM